MCGNLFNNRLYSLFPNKYQETEGIKGRKTVTKTGSIAYLKMNLHGHKKMEWKLLFVLLMVLF